MIMTSKLTTLALAALLAGGVAATAAQAADPAAGVIDSFNSALVDVMKSGKSAGAEGRYSKLIPAIDRTFDLPTMTRFAVGSAWAGYSAADQASLIKAFTRLTAANFAHNFSSFDGEQFKINPDVQTRGPDKLVRSQIISKSGTTNDLNYRMRQAGGGWKVIDVYFGSVSQLTAQRSDFASTLSSGGASALVQKMNAKSDSLLKG